MSKFAAIGKAKDKPGAAPAIGRPKNPDKKRGNPDYQSLTVYITKDKHKAIKKRLLEEDSARDMSDVIDDLVARWLAGKL